MNGKRLSLVVVAGACVIAAAPAVPADVVTLTPTKDNTLFEDQTGSLSNGAGVSMFAGSTGQGVIRRGLVEFDVDDHVPAGSTINSVTLTLFCTRVASNADQAVAVHRLTADWGEGTSNSDFQGGGQGAAATTGDATWIHRFYDTIQWAQPGGDFVATASASTLVGRRNQPYTWAGAGLAADVQFWVDHSDSDHGWIVIGNEGSSSTAKRFDTREGANPPTLMIDFTPPANTGACCFADGTCQIRTMADCQSEGGSYQGDGVSCSPNPCPQPPTGACCFTDGTCLVVTSAQCGSQGGTYQGDGSLCDPNPCPQPATGACCFNDTTCQELSEAECTGQGGTYQGGGTLCADVTCPLVLTPFIDPLPIAAKAVPTEVTPEGVSVYDIPILEVQQQLHSELPPTTVWGYSGLYPGPTIEARVGEPVRVNWISDIRVGGAGPLRTEHYLPVDTCPHGPDHEGNNPRTVVHLHGGHVAAADDGYPEDTILPGQMQSFYYPNNQLPATLWYHDHALGITRLNVIMGLAGFYLLRDDFEDALGLPSGEYEIEMAIQDRSFNPDGSLQYPADWVERWFGDFILVNGRVWPYLNVKQGKYRFRWLDGSTSRAYTLSLSDGATFWEIGTEGGLLAAPVPVTQLTITPGERADVVIDFAAYAPGTEIILTNSAAAPYPGPAGQGVVPNVMKFIVQGEPGHTDPLPASLRPFTPIDESEAVQHRDFVLSKGPGNECSASMWLINGLLWDDITEFPRLGTTEVWSFINRSGMTHPMHMHLVMFQVLDRQPFEVVGGEIMTTGPRVAPPAEETGWKDTVQSNPFEITRVIARFEDYAGKFPYHCHILEHEDHEMMRQFQTLYACPCEYDGETGVVNVFDLLAYLSLWFADDPAANLDGAPGVDVFDLLAYLTCWFPASAGGPCP